MNLEERRALLQAMDEFTSVDSIQIIHTNSRKPLAPVIRCFTDSEWSHSAIIVNKHWVIHSTLSGHGVHLYPLEELKRESKNYAITTRPCKNSPAIKNAAMGQIGKKYDLTALIGILARNRHWQQTDSWFCSELVAYAFYKANEGLFRPEAISAITPQHIWMLDSEIIESHNYVPRKIQVA